MSVSDTVDLTDVSREDLEQALISYRALAAGSIPVAVSVANNNLNPVTAFIANEGMRLVWDDAEERIGQPVFDNDRDRWSHPQVESLRDQGLDEETIVSGNVRRSEEHKVTTKTIVEFVQEQEDDYPSVYYKDLLECAGLIILECREFGYYQGDLVFTVRDGDRVGLTIVGYGSCTGCDALQAAIHNDGDWSEVQTLADQIVEHIIWPSDEQTLVEVVRDRIASNEWWLSDDEISTYVRSQAEAHS